jgi:transporter family protein
MKPYVIFAILAGVAWGFGGYFEKAGLRAMGIPPIAGITLRTLVALIILGLLSIPAWRSISNPSDVKAWLMIIIGGGIIAGSLGMWSFYSSLSLSENLGVTLALAFAFSPLTGTVVGLIKGDQSIDLRLALGLVAIIAGIILVQLSHTPART